MMMAELSLGLSMNLGRKAVPLAHLVKRIDEGPISMMMVELPLVLSMIMGNEVDARANLHDYCQSSILSAL